MPGDLCTAPRITLLSPLSATDVTDATLGASGHWLGTRTGAGGTASTMAPWTAGLTDEECNDYTRINTILKQLKET